MLERQGLLPVPIIITEPAIGYGGGLAMVYFHEKLAKQKGIPPSVSAVVAGATENGTWFGGAGHMGIWANDTVRYTGGIGKGLIKMEYFGRPGTLSNDSKGIKFETEALFLLQEIKLRLQETDFFIGAAYTFLDTSNTFELSSDTIVPDIPGVNFDSRSAAVSLLLSYDNRDNMFTPAKGIAAELKAMSFNEAWGGDQNFSRYSLSALYYTPLNDQLVLGLRADAKFLNGDAPFYAYPFIDMRGIKAMQYQGDKALLGEIELNWAFTPRWTLVGFVGLGKAYNTDLNTDSGNIYAKGVGIRYLIAKKLGLKMGLDVAKGPVDTAFYIQFGSSWALK